MIGSDSASAVVEGARDTERAGTARHWTRTQWRVGMGIVEAALVASILALAAAQMILLEDLSFADEAAYMFGRFDMLRGGITYSALYALGDLLFDDPIKIFYFGRALGVVVFVAGVWLASRLLSSRVAALTSAVLLISVGSPFVWPGVSSFAVGLMCVGAALLIRWPGRPLASGLASSLFWVAASARPEFWPAALLCTALSCKDLLVWIRSRRVGVAVSAIMLISVLAVPASLLATRSVDFFSDRTWVAFGQHYALTHVRANEDPWRDWKTVVERDFPGATGVVSAVRVSPAAALSVIPRNAGAILVAFRDSLAWGRSQVVGFRLTNIVGLMALAGLLVYGLCMSVGRLHRFGAVATLRPLIAPTTWPMHVSFALGSASVLVLAPRLHYLQLWIALGVVLAALAQEQLSSYGAPVLCGLVVLLIGVPLAWTTGSVVTLPSNKPVAEAVRELEKLKGNQTVASTWSELSLYLPNIRVVQPSHADRSIEEFLDRERVGVMVITDDLREGAWSYLPERGTFDPLEAGFVQSAPGSAVLVRK